jgi:DNA-3-methyladenine glycosylase II
MTGAERVVRQLFASYGAATTVTKGGWCLQAGLIHIASVDENRLLPLVQQHGIPTFYECCKTAAATAATASSDCSSQNNSCRHHDRNHAPTEDLKQPTNSFESLCRIVAGQFVSGKAAQAIWNRLLSVAGSPGLTPNRIVELNDADPIAWKRQAGLSRAKARAVVDIARQFQSGTLSEDLLSSSTERSEDDIREALLVIKGIGPWSCDMFLQFYLERSNILPLSDLGVRKGIAKLFGCSSKDDTEHLLRVYEPYRSLVTYYMWRVADTPTATTGERAVVATSKKRKQSTCGINSSDSTTSPDSSSRKRTRASRRTVTP